jgi:hypothetical protein
MLTMKENVRIGFDFAQRSFSGVHHTEISRACAPGRKRIVGRPHRLPFSNWQAERLPYNFSAAMAHCSKTKPAN